MRVTFTHFGRSAESGEKIAENSSTTVNHQVVVAKKVVAKERFRYFRNYECTCENTPECRELQRQSYLTVNFDR